MLSNERGDALPDTKPLGRFFGNPSQQCAVTTPAEEVKAAASPEVKAAQISSAHAVAAHLAFSAVSALLMLSAC